MREGGDEEMKDATSPSLPLSLLAGGLGQLRRVGETDEGTGVGGRRHGQPLHSGHGPGHTDVQANSYCQGNGRPGGAGVDLVLPQPVSLYCIPSVEKAGYILYFYESY